MKRILPLLAALALTGCDVVNHGDDSGERDGHGSIQATTVLTSSSLAGSAKARVVARKSGRTDFELPPSNVSGEVLSVVFPIDPAPDDGIVVFGDGRPDIAAASATLYPFDFLAQLSVNAAINIKPTLADGTVERVHPIFGYADFDFAQQDGTPRTVRVAFADVNGMVRGDKLLAVGTGFQWLDLDTGALSSTRPANPAVIEPIRDFSDPIRPNMVFFPMTVDLTSTIGVTASDYLNASTVESVVDFYMGNGITLVGQSTSNLSPEDLMQAFTLTQMLGTSGFTADATLAAHP